MAGKVFFIAGLFPDKDNFGASRAFPENGLRAAFPQVTSFAVCCRVAKSF